MRYFIQLSYQGGAFHGWQRQPNANSIQQAVEDALSTVLQVKTMIVGAGRTDTGVHAIKMYAHFDTLSPIINTSRLTHSINCMIGKDIAIHNIFPVHDNAHARFDATLRTYKYLVTHSKNPFLKEMAWYCSSPLEYDKMNQAAQALLTTSDFTSFAKLHSDAKTNICKIIRAEWSAVPNIEETYVFTISADRFLRNMVRAIVGTLVDVGRGNYDVLKFQKIIDSQNRQSAGESMPALGLYLYDIKYPYL